MRNAVKVLIVLAGFCLMGAQKNPDGCYQESTDDKEARRQERIQEQAVAQTGLPGITNFTEKKLVRKLYELRDQNIATYAYAMDMHGGLWFICNALGYGIPYGVQFTNPHKELYPGYHDTAMGDQAEPNGLFMPPTADGTWVICASEKNKGDIEPILVEPHVVTSPFPLNAVGSWQKK